MPAVRAVLRSITVGGTAPASRTMLFPSASFTVNDELTDFGIEPGDMLVICVACDGSNTAVLANTEAVCEDEGSPAGGKSSMNSRLFSYLVPDPVPSTLTFTRDNDSAAASATMVAVRPSEGGVLSVQAVSIPDAANGTVHGIEIEGIADPSLLVVFGANDSAFSVVTPPDGMTAQDTNDGSSHALRTYTQVNPGTGTLEKDFEWSATEEMHTLALLVKETVEGGGGTPVEVNLPVVTLRISAGGGLGEVEEGTPVEVDLPVATLYLNAQLVTAEVAEAPEPVEVNLPVAVLTLNARTMIGENYTPPEPGEAGMTVLSNLTRITDVLR